MNQRGETMLISVIMPIFNERFEYLKESIASVLAQSYGNIEVIIIDDSDGQEQKEFLANTSKKDSRIVYIHNNPGLGFVQSLNKALSLAKGDYIARVDSDDIQRADRFERQTAFLDAHLEIGIVGSSFDKISENGETIGIRQYPDSTESIKKQMTIKNAVAHPTVMLKRESLDRLGFYDESFPKAEDYEMWMRAIRKGIKIANINEPLVKYRVSDIAKRDNVNWKYNLRVKLRYFVLDRYVLQRVAGILIVGLMVILPLFVKRFLYTMYNRMV